MDVAHNPQAVGLLARRLGECGGAPVAVFGAMVDKPIAELLAPLIPVVGHWILVQPKIGRAAGLDSLRDSLLSLGVPGEQIQTSANMCDAVDAVLTFTKQTQVNFDAESAAVVYGSFYTVGEFLDIVEAS